MKFNNETIRTAVQECLENSKNAEEKYGHISDWDVSDVTNFIDLFKDISFKEITTYMQKAHFNYEYDDGTGNGHRFDAILLTICFNDEDGNCIFDSNEDYFHASYWDKKNENEWPRKDGYMIFDLVKEFHWTERIFTYLKQNDKDYEITKIVDFESDVPEKGDILHFDDFDTYYFDGHKTEEFIFEDSKRTFNSLSQLLSYLKKQKTISYKQINPNQDDVINLVHSKVKELNTNLAIKNKILNLLEKKDINSLHVNFYWCHPNGEFDEETEWNIDGYELINYNQPTYESGDYKVSKKSLEKWQIMTAEKENNIIEALSKFLHPASYVEGDANCTLEFKNNCLTYTISEDWEETNEDSAFKKTWGITNDGIIEIIE